jgi:GNAT superfamily N-acetyltransferase
VPLLTDLTRVRALLDRDRGWAAYAIGDLSPGLVEHCEWHASEHGSQALLLLYRGFNPPIAFAMGELADLRALFRELTAPTISLHLRPGMLDAMTGSYAPGHTQPMLRMVLRPHRFAPASAEGVRAVTGADLAALSALYEDGHRRGEAPAFFSPSMLQPGTFHGIWDAGALVAVAGTHLYSRTEGVCAIGNVYTRSDRRGHGLAARVTSAVAAHAIREGVATIVLNVGRDNAVARRVYERLGFEPYGAFVEGSAERIVNPG